MSGPQLLHALLEVPRALAEAATLGPSLPLLWGAAAGDGHPVLVLPGYLADDASTHLLRRYLRSLGYASHGWRLGRNLGPRDDLQRRLLRRAFGLHDEHGRKLSLVGWSLGGIYARELARAHPEIVRQVISLGSPFAGSDPTDPTKRVPPVPCTSIYSRSDGVVSWAACREADAALTENIEVHGSHVGLGFNPAVLYAVADRLSLAEGKWRRFDRAGLRRFLYPEDPDVAPRPGSDSH